MKDCIDCIEVQEKNGVFTSSTKREKIRHFNGS